MNNSSTTLVSVGWPLWSSSLLWVFIVVVSILTIFGNALVLLAYQLDGGLKRQISNRYIVSLAISDLIIGIEGFPLLTVYVTNEAWTLGQGFCQIWLFLDYTLCLVSILTVLLITVDRYLSVCHTAQYLKWQSSTKVHWAIAVSWAAPAVFFGIMIFGWQMLTGEEADEASTICEAPFLSDPYVNMIMYIVYYWATLVAMLILYKGIHQAAQHLERKSEARELRKIALLTGQRFGAQLGVTLTLGLPSMAMGQQPHNNTEQPQTTPKTDSGDYDNSRLPNDDDRRRPKDSGYLTATTTSHAVPASTIAAYHEIIVERVPSTHIDIDPITTKEINPIELETGRLLTDQFTKHYCSISIDASCDVSKAIVHRSASNSLKRRVRNSPGPGRRKKEKDNVSVMSDFLDPSLTSLIEISEPLSTAHDGAFSEDQFDLTMSEAADNALLGVLHEEITIAGDNSTCTLNEEPNRPSSAAESTKLTAVSLNDDLLSHWEEDPPARKISSANRNLLSFDATLDDIRRRRSQMGELSQRGSRCMSIPNIQPLPERSERGGSQSEATSKHDLVTRTKTLNATLRKTLTKRWRRNRKSSPKIQLQVPKGDGASPKQLPAIKKVNPEKLEKEKRLSWLIGEPCTSSSGSRHGSDDSMDSDISRREVLKLFKGLNTAGRKGNGAEDSSMHEVDELPPDVDTTTAAGSTQAASTRKKPQRAPIVVVDPATGKASAQSHSTNTSSKEDLQTRRRIRGGAGGGSEDIRSRLIQTLFAPIERLRRRRKKTRAERRARKAFRTISFIVGFFALFWSPYFVVATIYGFCADSCVPPAVFLISYYLCYINSSGNPLAYAFANRQFKGAFLRILRGDLRQL